MAKTIRLELDLPTSLDTDWQTKLNNNFEKIDAEFRAWMLELIGSETADITATLKGSLASFKARFDASVSNAATLIELDLARKSHLEATTSIATRLALLESYILAGKQGDQSLVTTTIPDELLPFIDVRSTSQIETTFADTGSLNRWSCVTPGNAVIKDTLLEAGEDIVILLGKRAYRIPVGEILFDDLPADGEYTLVAQSMTASASVLNVPIVHLMNQLVAPESCTISSANKITTLTVSNAVPGDILIVGDNSYVINASNNVSITIYSNFEAALIGTTVTASVYSSILPPIIALSKYTSCAEQLEIALEPGTVILGRCSVADPVFSFWPAMETTMLSRLTYVDSVTPWDVFESGDLIRTISWAIGVGIVKNIYPIVYTHAGETIFCNEWGTSYDPTTGNIYVNRLTDAYVCYSPALGATVATGDVQSWGVMVEV
jgi:hypothetical protein